jgi:toxin ParE1/3/4
MNPNASIKPDAIRDTAYHYANIAENSTKAAERFIKALDAAVEKIAEMPGIGIPCEVGELGARDIRLWHLRKFKKHIVVYRLVQGRIEVLRVLHAAQHLEKILTHLFADLN